MPSITYWNRIEVRPRSADFGPALSARVRDPLWLLTRQWQVGEFQGEDAASPAHVRISATHGKVLAWQDQDVIRPLKDGAPLEPAIQAEPFTPDLASRVELGQLFERLLSDAGVPELMPDFRRAYPIAAMSDDDVWAAVDRDTARFQQVVAGRALDGILLYEAAKAAAPALPADPAIDQPKRDAALAALTNFRSWIAEVWGDFGTTDPSIWNPERLEYRVSLAAAAPTNDAIAIDVLPAGGDDFAWQALEVGAAAPAAVTVPPGSVQTVTQRIIPSHVRFRGMPNHRFWDFENGQIDFGSLAPDRRDLTKLLVMDFMLVAGNDWFLVPCEVPVGSLCRIDALEVHDVFGGTTNIERADLAAVDNTQRWSLFSTSAAQGGVADYLVLPPTVEGAALDSAAIEDVRFLRDEMANMAWAVESVTENGLGEAWRGHERDLAVNPSADAGSTSPTPGSAAAPPLHYRVQTRVPENWIPLLPVLIDPTEGDIALERGAMLRDSPHPSPIAPAGRILQPSSLSGAAYRIREEEVPREGARVMRIVRRVRGCDGATYLWVARRKQIGRGEGSSGLRFDFTVET